jgi:hypothetical protein
MNKLINYCCYTCQYVFSTKIQVFLFFKYLSREVTMITKHYIYGSKHSTDNFLALDKFWEVVYFNTQNLRDVRNEEIFSNNILASCWNEESERQAITNEASMA